MTRVSFLVDGFNLYHSLARASADLGGARTKWLDVPALCSTFLHQIGGGSRLESIHYFSAPPDHVEQLKPGAGVRHRTYVQALGARGVEVELGKFKKKSRRCPECSAGITSHEEKETDVAIAVRLLQLLWSDCCDLAVLVSADSDLAPAIREATLSFSRKPVYCCFPYARGSEELRSLVKKCYRIKRDRYVQHQLPDPVLRPDGTAIAKPANW